VLCIQHLALAELSINTMLAVIVALAILIILATCILEMLVLVIGHAVNKP